MVFRYQELIETMKNIYNITKGQLITAWVCGVFLFFILGNKPEVNTLDIVIGVGVLFVLVFYTIGWRNHKKNLEDVDK